MAILHGVNSPHAIDKTGYVRPLLTDDDGIFISQSYETAIARGLITGASKFYGYGEYTSSGAATNHLIWPDGVLYVPAASGVQPSLVSTSTEDSSGGTGIEQVEIHYLDADLAQQTETLTLTGATPKTMAATDVRFINCMHAISVGSTGAAVGSITATYSTNTMSVIGVGATRCKSSARMVPASKRAFISAVIPGLVESTATANGHIDLVATEIDGNQHDGIFFPHAEVNLQNNTTPFVFPVPKGPFQAGTIIGMYVTVDKAATTSGSYYGWLEDA